SSLSVARALLRLSKVMVTSARPRLRRDAEPLKITSVISPPRRLLALCSPRIQRTASTILDLPEPFGPTIAVMPSPNSNTVLSAKLLKPTSSSRLSMGFPQRGVSSARRQRYCRLRRGVPPHPRPLSPTGGGGRKG